MTFKSNKFRLYFLAARPAQWIKQTLITIPVIALGDQVNFESILNLAFTVVVFSSISSQIYIFNDIQDLEHDLLDRIKNKRPIIAGLINPKESKQLLILLSVINVFLISTFYLLINNLICIYLISVYIFMNIIYSKFNLKKYKIIGSGIVAVGFPIRFSLGSAVLNLNFSYWAFALIYELALIMVLGKRFQKNLRNENTSNEQLSSVSIFWILSLITVIGFFAATYMSFISSADIILSWGGEGFLLCGTIPLIIGLLRYLELCFLPNEKYEISEYFYKDIFLISSGIIYILVMYLGKINA